MLPVEMDAPVAIRRANTAGRVRRPCLTAAPPLAGTSVANFGAPNLHSPGLGSLIGQIFRQEMLSKRRVHKPLGVTCALGRGKTKCNGQYTYTMPCRPAYSKIRKNDMLPIPPQLWAGRNQYLGNP